MTLSTKTLLLSLLMTACDFPRPADVGGDAGDSDGRPSSNACCVTAAECTRLGSSSPRPCQLGVCVHNECTVAVGSCDGDEDCPAGTPVCIDDGCHVCRSSSSCPASRPACDESSHECRACARDSECAAGACDLGLGSCVDERAILYASPAGTSADACTRLSPCSLSHAASIVDAAHMYIVLLPGSHTSGATFAGKTAIVAGNSATIDVTSSRIDVVAASSVKFRDFGLNASQEFDVFGSRDAISIEGGTEVAIDNMQATLIEFVNAIRSAGVLTIRNSRISTGDMTVSGPLVMDRVVLFDVQIGLFLTGVAFEISNSLFIGSAGSGGIFVSQDGASNQDGALILNNTFI